MKKKILTFLLTGAMTLSLFAGVGMTANAAPDDEKLTEAIIEKNLEMDKNVTTPEVSFTFEIEGVSVDGKTTETPPTISDKTLTFASTDAGTTQGNLKTVNKATANILEGITFPHAGVYVYKVTETANTYSAAAGETMTYSQAEYEMTVMVINDGTSNVKVEKVVLEESKDDEGEDQTDQKTQTMAFTNVYGKNTTLEVSKETVGDYADKTKQFTFTLTLGNAATETGTKQYEGTITRKDTSTEEITVTIGTPQEFTLGDGDSLYIENLPVGTICNITETGAEDYTPSLTYTLGNSDPQQTQGQVGTDFACGPFEMAEVSNTLDFTNTYKEVPTPTGILTNYGPAILVMLVAVAGIIACIALRRRSNVR